MLVLICLFYIGANMAHPFTPTLFTNLGLPDYMFGVAYAFMSIMGFIMGPFWGKVSDHIGKVPVMALGCFGYALGQFFFSLAATVPTVILARMFSGVFCNATIICALAYIADNARNDERSKLLAWQAALIAVFGAMGYLLGGVLGDVSIPFAFLAQITVLLVTGILIALFLADSNADPAAQIRMRTSKEGRDGSAASEGDPLLRAANVSLCAEDTPMNHGEICKKESLADILRESNPFHIFAQFPVILSEVSESETKAVKPTEESSTLSSVDPNHASEEFHFANSRAAGSMKIADDNLPSMANHAPAGAEAAGGRRLSPAGRALLLLFITAAAAALATTCFDSSFNYYIRAEFNFPSTYNGIIKAAVGIIGFIADTTICLHLIRRPHPDRILSLVYAGCAAFIALALFADTIPAFIAVCIVYYVLNSLYLPIQQSLVMRGATERNSGTVSGLFNSIRSIGNVTGSLSAGFLYTLGSTIPFTVAAVVFAGTALTGVVSRLVPASAQPSSPRDPRKDTRAS